MSLRGWLFGHISRFLTRPRRHYERRGWIDLASLQRSIRKGDVLLVEGDQRVSEVIKFLTQSSWSHAALYVGDELIRNESTRDWALRTFGGEARHMLVEALFDGVVASPLTKYIDFNIRVCRPHRLRPEDRRQILGRAIAAIGWRYDLRNVLDLALHLPVAMLLPGRFQRRVPIFGSRVPTEVICSSLLGRLFHEVSFPVLPSPGPAEEGVPPARGFLGLGRAGSAHARAVFRRRHPTLLTPRDFDLSPHFEIVSTAAGQVRQLDYRQIQWAEEPCEAPPAPPRAFRQR